MSMPVVSLRDARFDADKYGFIEELRSQGNHFLTPEGAPVFLNESDVAALLKCDDFRFTFNLIDDSASPYLANAIRHELLNMHGDQHHRLSRLVKQALRDRILEDMRRTIVEIVDGLIDAFPHTGDVEFCATFADPLPARVLGPMFDVPYEEAEGLNEWIKVGGRKVDALQSGVDIEEVEEANRKVHDFLRTLLAERRDRPSSDLFSELLQAEFDGDRMSEDEAVYLSAELASAGVDTTRTQLPLILHALLTHPDQMEKLRTDPSLALRAVDEGMRFAPLPWALPHAAVHDVQFGGAAFKEGDLAFVLVPAANRDPSATERPQTFDITRPRARHFSFGSGLHACPGAQLARMEMSIALARLVERLPKIAINGSPQWQSGMVGRGFDSLTLSVSVSR